MDNLKGKTIRSGIIKIGAQGINFFLRIGSLMILARLLDPKDFGLVGMVTVVTGVFGLFKEAGLSMVTIQRPTITNEEVSTLFWLNMLVGLILGVLSLATAPILAIFYQEPALFWVTAALGTGFIFNAAGVQHAALLVRDMRFGTLSVVETISQLGSTLIGIVMALSGYGYWALVAMTVIQPVLSTTMVWATTPWVPGMPHRSVEIGPMMRFGGTATLNALVGYVAYNLEKVLLGRFWGAEALGIYGRAYQLLSIPSDNLISAVGNLMFGSLSRIQNDPGRVKKYFLTMYSLLLSLTIPSTLACVLFADDIVFLILGQKWKDVVPLFRLLAPAILAFALINPLYWLSMSIGMAGRCLRINMVLAPLMITAYAMGLPYGLSGVAIAYSAVMTLWVVPHLFWTLHGTMIAPRDLIPAVARPFVSTVVAVALTYLAQAFYGQLLASLPRLILGGGILLLVYLWILLIVMGQKEIYLNILRGLRGYTPLAKANI